MLFVRVVSGNREAMTLIIFQLTYSAHWLVPSVIWNSRETQDTWQELIANANLQTTIT